ncbi:hypothetical protein TVAG_335560 [Trichomonas vaginalis G3]|uniref:Uncharacterized protein n=1 Tax=Trichomonas vaginalis (strain ATCC PRA-98 / G3) TaxID=412133 RepID=A2FC83_TRIV3|nr:spectrin binding [Trichomonas vaginalis G3]EAX97496.1 hypothetical protein TVAG_335560 [Trichomonas vaginalis G3]KAI5547066.1 spectrin binding [Trichomonas vaginalis G3]|eukprot:XP_001310426.1 hypothetical protein [Trichomonas vaginalis G3]
MWGRGYCSYYDSDRGYKIKQDEFDIEHIDKLDKKADTSYQIDRETIEHQEFKGTHSIDFEVYSNGLGLMHIAAIWNSLDEFIFLHKTHKLDINVKDRSNHIPLHYACSQGSTEVVAYILSQLSDEEFKKPEIDHNLCLKLAARTSSWRIIEILCQKGIDMKKNGQEAIEIATTLTDIATLRVLLSHSGENSRVTSSPVLSAITFDKIDCLKMLFANGFEADKPVMDMLPLYKALDQYTVNQGIVQLILRYSSKYDIDTQNRMSTVHYICKCMNPKIAADILVHDIDVNKLDEHGRPGPYYFQSKPDGDPAAILDMLLKKGFNVNIKFGSPSISILNHFMTLYGNWERIVKWFVEHDADLEEKLANSKDKRTLRDAIKKVYPKINVPDKDE